MTPSQQDLEQWLAQVRQAKSRAEVFKLMDEFRPLAWSDEQRSSMARTYIRVLDGLAPSASDEKPPQQPDSPGGPVWYEKM